MNIQKKIELSSVNFSPVNFFYQNADKRIRDRFLMNSPVYIIFLTIFYVVLTKKLLTVVKNNRKYVINTKVFLILFYVYSTIMSGYIVMKIVKYMIWSNYNFRCSAVDMSTEPEAMEVRTISQVPYAQ